MPVYFTAKEYEDVFAKEASSAMLAAWQIAAQRKF
jgi:hypothetical protein